MKPDIIKRHDIRIIKGYVGVICGCGNVLHVKNVPTRARERITIECPCGFQIRTIYAKDTFDKENDNDYR